MEINEQTIIDIILKEKYISAEDLKKAIDEAKKSRISLLPYLLENNYISYDLVGQAMAEFFGVPYVDLRTNVPAPEQVLVIPEKMARAYQAVLYEEKEDAVVVATSDPHNQTLLNNLRFIFKNKNIKLVYAIPYEIEKCFLNYKSNLSERFSNIIKSENKVAPEITRQVIEDAANANASDIHFEPRGEKISIRFRIDGFLHEVGEISRQYYENIVNYLKILASLRIDEHKSTQDGAIRFQSELGDTDVRLSLIPTIEGEKVVLRLLSRHVGDLSVENLGLSERDKKMFEQSVKKPFGMIVISGPTGSGKTTTLYALLRTINNPEINITSIEDPVEYVMEGTNQIQVNTETKVTFARGLRSIVRQDPDVIFVGEVRDKETAEIAVNAALTGHLLFSTFHANNASTTFLRLIDMGVERYLLASTLELVASQRLVRRICEKCRYSQPVTPEYLQRFPDRFVSYLKEIKTVYQGKGCPVCHGTGYKGRIAAYEMIQVTPAIQELVMKKALADEIWKMAQSQGSHSLFEDAWKKAEMGITTFEEVFRVTPTQ
jgi:type IV pilus assembly protein PilB